MCHTFLSDCLKVSSEIFIPISHTEGQQHEIGGRDDGEGAGHRLTQPAAQRRTSARVKFIFNNLYTYKNLLE